MPCLMTKQYSAADERSDKRDGSIATCDSEPIYPGDFDIVASFEALTESMTKCLHGVKWKDSPASYFLNGIEENLKLEKQLETGKYKQRKPKKFRITYPRERDIVSVAFRDRVFQRSLNDNIIYPRISRSFIYDNMACQQGKGPDKARDRLMLSAKNTTESTESKVMYSNATSRDITQICRTRSFVIVFGKL